MVKRHLQHVAHGHALLGAPSQQVGNVLRRRAEHFRAHEQAAAMFAIHPQQAPVLADYLAAALVDRKSTRLNSSHVRISYAVFCLKKKSSNNSSFSIHIKTRSITSPTFSISLSTRLRA